MDPKISNSNYTSLAGDNPVFKFDVPTVDNRMQDKGNQDKEKIDDPQEQWVEGLNVSGRDIDDEKTYAGKIIFIEKNKDGEVEYVKIQDKDEKERRLDVDSLTIIRKEEKKIKGFNEWKVFESKRSFETMLYKIEELLYQDSYFKKLLDGVEINLDNDYTQTKTIIIDILKVYKESEIKEIGKEWLRFCKDHKFDQKGECDYGETDNSLQLTVEEFNFKR